jgi:GNAT superfamily N-acetyltransferase
MTLTLDDIDRNPERISYFDYFEEMSICFRPLLRTDEIKLAEFLENLSLQTREFSNRDSYDLNEAREICFAINRYDKLRLVALINNETIIALFEFSLSLTEDDCKRFSEEYNIILNEITDARFGPCVSDQYQNRHLGQWLFEKIKLIARQMGKERLILWGGVFRHNKRAIRFYEKIGFQIFTNVLKNKDNGDDCLDGIFNLYE